MASHTKMITMFSVSFAIFSCVSVDAGLTDDVPTDPDGAGKQNIPGHREHVNFISNSYYNLRIQGMIILSINI